MPGFLFARELLRFLVDRVVGEMQEHVLQVPILWTFVFLGGKPHHPFLIAVDSQWVNPNEQNVNPQVVLQPIDQIRVS